MRYRYHLNLAGGLYLGVTMLVGFASTVRPNNLLVWIFGFLLSLVVISGLTSGGALFRLTMRRLDPVNGRVDRPLVVRYSVRGGSRYLPLFDVRITESRRGADRADGWWTHADPASAWVMHAGPGEVVHGEAVFVPRRRGRMRFDAFEARSSFPFGLVGKSVTVRQEMETLVFPRTFPIRENEIDRLLGGGVGGGRAGSGLGSAGEYAGLREYRPGDSIRSVAWKRSRAGENPVVIQRAIPAPPRLIVLLDLRRSTGRLRFEAGVDPREREEAAITFAASLAESSIRHGVEVGLRIAGIDLPEIPIRGGRRHLDRMLAHLASIDLDETREDRALAVPASNVAAMVAIHVDRVDVAIGHERCWHLLPANMDDLMERRPEATEAAADPDRDDSATGSEAAA